MVGLWDQWRVCNEKGNEDAEETKAETEAETEAEISVFAETYAIVWSKMDEPQGC